MVCFGHRRILRSVKAVAVDLLIHASPRVVRHALGAIRASVSRGNNKSLEQYPWSVNLGAVGLPTLPTVRVARHALGAIQAKVSVGGCAKLSILAHWHVCKLWPHY